MFIELTYNNSANKIAVNLNNITDFLEDDGTTKIFIVGEDNPIRVNESYDEVKLKVISLAL